MVFDDIKQLVSVTFFNIFDAKDINDEDELDRSLLVSPPKARSCGRMVVASWIELNIEEFVGKDSQLRETMNAQRISKKTQLSWT